MKVIDVNKRRFVRAIIPAGIVLLLGFTSCAYYEKPGGSDDIPQVVSFSNDLIPFFETSCALGGCHAANAVPPELTESNAYTSLSDGGYLDTDNPEQSLIYTKINVGGSMAQFSTPRDTKMVLRWIEQGAENN